MTDFANFINKKVAVSQDFLTLIESIEDAFCEFSADTRQRLIFHCLEGVVDITREDVLENYK